MANTIMSKADPKGFMSNPTRGNCLHCSMTMYYVPKPGSGNPIVCWSCGEKTETG